MVQGGIVNVGAVEPSHVLRPRAVDLREALPGSADIDILDAGCLFGSRLRRPEQPDSQHPSLVAERSAAASAEDHGAGPHGLAHDELSLLTEEGRLIKYGQSFRRGAVCARPERAASQGRQQREEPVRP